MGRKPSPADPKSNERVEENHVVARIAVGLVALLIAFFGVAFIIAGLEIADTPTCEDVLAGKELPREGECYDGSSMQRTIQVVLGIAAGGIGVLAVIPGFAYAIRSTRLKQWATMVAVAVALVVVSVILGEL
jgi:hypothetical protein